MLSIDSQLNELKNVAYKQQFNVVGVLTESKSAKDTGRPVFNEIVEKIKAGEADSILVWNPDRLSRNSVDAGILIYLFDKGKLKEIATPYQSFKNTPNDKFLLSILWGQAKLDNDNKGINVKRGMKTKAEMGWYPYPALNGYLNTPERPKGYKIVVKDPSRFNLVRKMWDLVLTGVYTVAQIHKIVNEQWHYRDRRNKPLSRSCLYELFSHPFYYGFFQYDGVWHKGKHEAMVTKEEWDKVQKLIHRPTVPHLGNKFLFTELLRCGKCSFTIVGSRKTKLYKRTHRKASYTYYRCTRKNKEIDCHEKPVTEKALIDEFVKVLEQVEIDKDFKNWALKYYHELDDYEAKHTSTLNSNIQKQITIIENKLSTLLELVVSGSISKSEYDNKRQELIAEKSSLQEKQNKPDDQLSKVTRVIETAHNIRQKFLNKSFDEKRELIRSVGSNFFLKGGLVRPDLEKPYFILADAKKNPRKYLKRLEPATYRYLSTQTIALAKANPAWLPRLDSDQ